MSKQARFSLSEGISSVAQKRDDLIFERLKPDAYGEDLLKVLRSINAFEGLSSDNALEGQMRSRVAGKVVTLDNMANSAYYRRGKDVRSRGSVVSKELLSHSSAVKYDLYETPKTLNLADVEDLNSMWGSYATVFLGVLSELDEEGSRDGMPLVEYKSLLLRKYFEFVGSKVRISASSNLQLVGKEGFIVRERENILDLIDSRGKIRMIPKDVCVFEVFIPGKHPLLVRGADIIRRLAN
jgi:RNase P/RNase MRP subunit p29